MSFSVIYTNFEVMNVFIYGCQAGKPLTVMVHQQGHNLRGKFYDRLQGIFKETMEKEMSLETIVWNKQKPQALVHIAQQDMVNEISARTQKLKLISSLLVKSSESPHCPASWTVLFKANTQA